MRNHSLPGRSAVHAVHGIAATSHPLATGAAIAILRQGGNAIDAAIAACAVQCVVEPMSTGIGGDCFALLCRNGALPVIGYNGSGRAPAAASREWFATRGIGVIDVSSPHAVTIPGAIDAWTRLHADHGRLDFADVLEPAIRFAADGYAVAPITAGSWGRSAQRLVVHPETARIFLPGGRSPAAGSIHRQPELAATLRLIARQGRAAFYEGPVAQDMVATLRALGGLHTLEDFAAHRGEYVTPIATDYRGVDVFEIPPNGQGITALLMLNILRGFDLARLDPHGPERFHLEIEAARIAYAARDLLIADPAKAAVPTDGILSARYAERLRAAIDPKRAAVAARLSDFPLHPDTVYLTVVDRDRNAVSFINSLFFGFGSCITAGRSGVVFQNRGTGFVLKEGHPNCIAPGKRPLHTIIPGMAAKDGRPLMPFGVMGGQYQACGHAHLLTNLIDFGMDVQEALDSPRLFFNGPAIEVEAGVPAATVEGLRRLGHEPVPVALPHGGGQAIRFDWVHGTLEGGSDPRKDGLALGY
jgi:gamma-glutamyltranspeptidase/glutathione hydrolase